MRKLRLSVLVALLVGVSGWAALAHHRRAARTRWHKPLTVAVLLLGEADHARWRAGLGQLETWISAEMARYRRVVDDPPIRFTLYGPLAAEAPQFLPPSDDWWTRARHAWQLSRALSRLDAAAGVAGADVRLYVQSERSDATPTVEGAGEVGGEVGFVHATVDEDLALSLAAVVHELFHCLGAEDRYDAAGHALPDDGLDDQERGHFAEVMVGEVAKGRLPRSLAEVRVGKITAKELRWSLTPTGR